MKNSYISGYDNFPLFIMNVCTQIAPRCLNDKFKKWYFTLEYEYLLVSNLSIGTRINWARMRLLKRKKYFYALTQFNRFTKTNSISKCFIFTC